MSQPGPWGDSTAGEIVRQLSSEPAATGLFTDFDGTLSPIVGDPEAARPVAGALEVLVSLAGALGKVAIVSGRPASWLGALFGRDPEGLPEIFGLHGLERFVGGAAVPVAPAEEWASTILMARQGAAEAEVPDLVIEDKGLSLTLHWRQARSPETTGAIGTSLANRLASSTGLLLRPGKASVELVPPLGIDKGTVVREQARGLSCVAYIGDDVGDLAGFDALDDLAGTGAFVARIAVTSAEAPADLVRRADIVLDSPEEAVRLLQAVAALAGSL
ncbi:MAG: trehalose-phosphatase [Acidimicrobiales bacterium]